MRFHLVWFQAMHLDAKYSQFRQDIQAYLKYYILSTTTI